MEAWDLGQNISGDKQAIVFKEKHQEKQRINYKNEGDGVVLDTLCKSGYTYTFYFKIIPPKLCICSALRAR